MRKKSKSEHAPSIRELIAKITTSIEGFNGKGGMLGTMEEMSESIEKIIKRQEKFENETKKRFASFEDGILEMNDRNKGRGMANLSKFLKVIALAGGIGAMQLFVEDPEVLRRVVSFLLKII